ADAARDGEGAHIVSAGRRDEIREAAIGFFAIDFDLLRLLPEMMETGAFDRARLVAPDDDVVADAIRREEAVHGAEREKAFGDDAVEQNVGVRENLARLFAVFFVIENLRVNAAQFPRVEERRPVNERPEIREFEAAAVAG